MDTYNVGIDEARDDELVTGQAHDLMIEGRKERTCEYVIMTMIINEKNKKKGRNVGQIGLRLLTT